MRQNTKLFAVLASAGLIAASPVPKGPIWMAGDWLLVKGDEWTEEHWTTMRGGIMLGAGRSGKGDVLRDWEQTRIDHDVDGVLTFWASPLGATPVPFKMVSMTSVEIVFANPKHDYPQRIRYWRDGKSLNAEISLADGSRPNRWHYRPVP